MARRKSKNQKLKAHHLKEIILKYFLNHSRKRMNAGQLGKKLKLSNSKDSIAHALNVLHKEDKLRKLPDGKYVLDRKNAMSKETIIKKELMVGTVDMTRSGDAYIVIDGQDQDIYVPSKHMGTALNKDEVEVSVVFFKNKKPIGKVHKVLKRATSQIVGKIHDYKKIRHC